MRRTIDILRYLPEYLRTYEEIRQIMNAENPDLQAMWSDVEQILDNSFILHADEYGISKFEAMLGITPAATDSLELRRQRVLAYWNGDMPYTWRTMLDWLNTMCGEGNYTATLDNNAYTLEVIIDLKIKGLVDDVYGILSAMVPANLVLTVRPFYNLWRDLTPYTWSAMSGTTWQDAREEVLP